MIQARLSLPEKNLWREVLRLALYDATKNR